MHISRSFSPIGAELVVSIRWWIILAPGYISHHPLARLYFGWQAWHWYSRRAVVTRILAGELMQKVAEMCTCQSLASKCPWCGTSYKDLCVNRGKRSLAHTHRRSSYHCLVLYVFIPCIEAPASETDLCQRVQVVAAWLFACHATLFISQSTWRFWKRSPKAGMTWIIQVSLKIYCTNKYPEITCHSVY